MKRGKHILIIAILVALLGGGILIWTADFNKKVSTTKVNLFYYNQIRDKEIAEYIPCSPDAVLPVEREVAATKTPIQDAVKLLLEGKLTNAEKAAGFATEFPLEGLRLIGASRREGVLTLGFDDPLNKTSGGSCRVRLLWSQIQKTAKQFSGIEEVRFIPEWLFQP